VSNAVVLPVSGWFASRIGRKRFYMICVALFTVSSLLCGVAPSLSWLIVFRVLQGVGGGGLAPSEQSILADTFPPERRGIAFAVYGMAVVLAPAIGPTLGGYITDHYSWRWVFLINVPVGIVSLALTSRVVTDPPHLRRVAGRPHDPIDFVGFGLLAIGLGSLEVVLDKGQQENWFDSSFITGFALTAAVTLIAFIVWEVRQKHPVVEVQLFRHRNFAFANVMMLVLGLCLYGSTVLLPQYLQVLMGYSAEQAGMVLSPGGFVVIAFLPFVGQLVSKVDARWLIAVGFIVLAASMLYMSTHLYPGIDFHTAVMLRVYQSVGLAFLFVPINNLIFAGMPPEKSNAISGIVNLARNMGGDIGISFVTTFIARRSQFHQNRLASNATLYDAPFSQAAKSLGAALARAGTSSTETAHKALAALYRQMQGQAMTLAYIEALKVMGVATACMLPLLLLTRKAAPGAAPAAH
jgi:DHA2 family multidrug resistance protein